MLVCGKAFPYEGDDGWVEDTLYSLHKCLNKDEIPEPGEDCSYCQYVAAVNKVSEN